MGKEVKISFAVIGVLLLIFGAVLYHRLSQGTESTVLAASGDGKVANDTSAAKPGARPIVQGADTRPPRAMSFGAEGSWVRRASQNEIDQSAALTESAESDAQPPSPSLAPAIEPESQPPYDERQADTAPPEEKPEVADTTANPFGARARRSVKPPREEDENSAMQQAQDDDPQISPTTDPLPDKAPLARPTVSDSRRPARRDVLPTAQNTAPTDQSAERFDDEPRQRFLKSEPHEPATTDLQHLDDRRSRAVAGDSFRPQRVPVTDGQYTVEPNDTYWTISQKVYGTDGFFKAIQEHNKRKHPRPDKLQVGDVLSVPEASVLMQTYPKLCPKPRKTPPSAPLVSQASARKRADNKTYVVEEGDTLFDIARYRLGKASRWAEIYDLNRDVLGEDFNYLQPGTALVMPSGPRETEAMTRRGEESQQR